jgi:hypothetical protein
MIFLTIIFGMMPPMICPVASPLVNLQTTIEAMAIEIVDLPNYKMVDLSIVIQTLTRGYLE